MVSGANRSGVFARDERARRAVVERHNPALLHAYAAVVRITDSDVDSQELADVRRKLEADSVNILCLVLDLAHSRFRTQRAWRRASASSDRSRRPSPSSSPGKRSLSGRPLPLDAEELTAILHSATYGLQQHVAPCARRTVGELFERLQQLLVNRDREPDSMFAGDLRTVYKAPRPTAAVATTSAAQAARTSRRP